MDLRQRAASAGRHSLDRLLAKGGYSRAHHQPLVDRLEDDFVRLHMQAAPFTMTSRERMYALWQSVRYVRDVPGDVVECGVWRGGSSILAALTLAHAGDNRIVWMYDTFEGMPPPGEHDLDLFGVSGAEWERDQPEDGNILLRAGLMDVLHNLNDAGVGRSQVKLVRGRVEDTIPAEAPDHIALLRLDTDWYESTRHELEQLWPRLQTGGVLIVDDYGHWQGARRAVDEFFAGRTDAPMLTRIDYTGRLGIKL